MNRTTTEQILKEKYDNFLKRKFVSIEEINDLLLQVDKVLQQISRVTLSRDKWKTKFFEAKNG